MHPLGLIKQLLDKIMIVMQNQHYDAFLLDPCGQRYDGRLKTLNPIVEMDAFNSFRVLL